MDDKGQATPEPSMAGGQITSDDNVDWKGHEKSKGDAVAEKAFTGTDKTPEQPEEPRCGANTNHDISAPTLSNAACEPKETSVKKLEELFQDADLQDAGLQNGTCTREDAGNSVPPTHWRYLWDSRRSASVPADPGVTTLAEGMVLSSAAEFEAGSVGFVDEVRDLLSDHYVEDELGDFRFMLSAEYLRWALLTPKTDLRLLLAVREVEDDNEGGELVAFLAAIPFSMSFAEEEDVVNVAMVDFVCVRRDHRGKRICPFLFGEVQRRCRELVGIDRLIATSGSSVPEPFMTARYFHRINPSSLDKLVDCNWACLPRRMTVDQYRKTITFNTETSSLELRPIVAHDVPQTRRAYNEYTRRRHKIAHVFGTDESFAHLLLPRNGVMASYAVVSDDPLNFDFISFYLNSTQILQDGEHKGKTLCGAFLYYYMCTKTDFRDLLEAAMPLVCSGFGADMINVLPCSDASDTDILRSLRFGKGTGELMFYGYNLRPGQVLSADVSWFTT